MFLPDTIKIDWTDLRTYSTANDVHVCGASTAHELQSVKSISADIAETHHGLHLFMEICIQ